MKSYESVTISRHMEGRQTMGKEKATCETCESCVYIGEGDFICDRSKDPVLVVIDWQAEREACEKWSKK